MLPKFCSNCGSKLNENADLCLKCGVLVNKDNTKEVSADKNKKKGFPVWVIVLIIFGSIILLPTIIVIVTGILLYNIFSYEKFNDNETIPKEDETIYNYSYEGTIGDSFEIDGIRMTLKNASKYAFTDDSISEQNGEYLVFFLDVENTSFEEKFISYLDFNGDIDYDVCSPESFDDEINDYVNLNTKLDPGEIVNGYVAFKIDTDWLYFVLNYESLNIHKKISFYVDNNSIEIINNNEV